MVDVVGNLYASGKPPIFLDVIPKFVRLQNQE